MEVTLKLNRVGMTMEEATLTRWCVRPGERFAKGDVLYEIETEKVTEEVIAPAAGTMLKTLVAEEAVVAVGGDVCVIDTAPP